MKLGRQFVIGALAIGLLFFAACTKKKPQLPNQAQVPMDAVAVPLPDQIAEVSPPPPPPEPKPKAPPPEEPKPAPAKHHKRKAPPATTQANSNAVPANPVPSASNNTTTVAVAHPPANPAAEPTPPDTAIAADVTSAQLSHQKQTTAQLLDATEKTLGGLTRGLSHDEEEMVAQIRSYITQSKSATTAGDFERAYNLATKAHLLSDALVKK
jgi:outer membrane biosynthesis protein TonB